MKRRFSGFLGFSGLEIFHGTILVKNQYVEHHFRPLGALGGRVMFDFIFFPARGRFSGANFFRMTEYFLKSPFSGFLGFSGLEIFHATILVKNQYVEHHFRPLGPLGGRVMVDFIFFSGPGTIFNPTPPDPKVYSPHAWCRI